MKLSFCVITKGDSELDKLKTLIDSVTTASGKTVFDSVHITTNGEHKQTERWCKSRGFDHSFLKWNDNFAEQRNFNFARAKDADYIVWADSDDVILNPHLVREVAETANRSRHDAVYFTYWYGCKFNGEPSIDTFTEVELSQMRERILKVGKTTWKGRLHETPVPLDGEHFKYTRVDYSEQMPVVWMHLGASRDESEEVLEARMARNKRILELQLQDELNDGGADPRTLLYLMKIYVEYSEDTELLKKVLNMGEEYITKSGWDEERSVCYKLMSVAMGHLGQHEKAVELLLKAIKEFPYEPLLYLYLARAYKNLGNWDAVKHWLKIGMELDLDEARSQMANILELKVLGAELMLEYYLYGQKNIRKAWEASRMLAKVHPTENNIKNEQFLYDQKELDLATEHAHKLLQYYMDIGREEMIATTIETLPKEIKSLPFMIKLHNRYAKPRVWGEKEICYYASFGHPHFEKWNGNSLKSGIGGSETAVIKLSENWTQMEYKVTVFCDTPKPELINGVIYLPYIMFNPKDKFNIFIQWRHNSLVGKISAKKFLIDLHDIWWEDSYIEKIEGIDKIMVKSKYHRELGKGIIDEKFEIIGNGI